MRLLVRNLCQAGRLAARRPALALAVIGTLGGGFGLAAAIATVVHGLLLRPLPFAEPDRLVLVREVDAAGRQLGASEPTFNDVVTRSRSFETLAYTAGSFPLVVTGGRDPVRARVSYASDAALRGAEAYNRSSAARSSSKKRATADQSRRSSPTGSGSACSGAAPNLDASPPRRRRRRHTRGGRDAAGAGLSARNRSLALARRGAAGELDVAPMH